MSSKAVVRSGLSVPGLGDNLEMNAHGQVFRTEEGGKKKQIAYRDRAGNWFLIVAYKMFDTQHIEKLDAYYNMLK